MDIQGRSPEARITRRSVTHAASGSILRCTDQPRESSRVHTSASITRSSCSVGRRTSRRLASARAHAPSRSSMVSWRSLATPCSWPRGGVIACRITPKTRVVRRRSLTRTSMGRDTSSRPSVRPGEKCVLRSTSRNAARSRNRSRTLAPAHLRRFGAVLLTDDSRPDSGNGYARRQKSSLKPWIGPVGCHMACVESRGNGVECQVVRYAMHRGCASCVPGRLVVAGGLVRASPHTLSAAGTACRMRDGCIQVRPPVRRVPSRAEGGPSARFSLAREPSCAGYAPSPARRASSHARRAVVPAGPRVHPPRAVVVVEVRRGCGAATRDVPRCAREVPPRSREDMYPPAKDLRRPSIVRCRPRRCSLRGLISPRRAPRARGASPQRY